jgi:hypothetical protein
MRYTPLTQLIHRIASRPGTACTKMKHLSIRNSTLPSSIFSGTKTMIAVGGWMHNNPGLMQTCFSQMAKSRASGNTFVNSVVEFLRTYRFDGLDLDWEYPALKERGGKQKDSDNCSLIVKDLGGYGARVRESLSNAINFIVRLFLYHFLHMMSLSPFSTTQTTNKHHHHGDGDTCPSSSMDLINPRCPSGWRPCACSFQGHQ